MPIYKKSNMFVLFWNIYRGGKIDYDMFQETSQVINCPTLLLLRRIYEDINDVNIGKFD
jgi:hypothetical protein